ncbi:MAG: hypothetical protein IKC56_03685 [Clostridia bacterium]|nr:hypothetical protein [Clostridia bacterium]
MFLSAGQFYYAAVSLAVGGICGALHALFPKRGVFALLGDALFFFCFTALFLCVEHRFRFPDFRPYMGACAFCGFFLLRKILLQLVALYKKTWYNKKAKRKKSVKTDRS